MSKFQGYLFGTVKDGNLIKFPHKYIEVDTYSTLPNSREEIKTFRDDNTRNLTRVTAQGTKSSISFTIMEGLNLEELTQVLKFFTDNESNKLQRKIFIRYWNMEDLDYKEGYFYRPDIQYKVKEINDTDMIVNEFEISLVEY